MHNILIPIGTLNFIRRILCIRYLKSCTGDNQNGIAVFNKSIWSVILIIDYNSFAKSQHINKYNEDSTALLIYLIGKNIIK